MTSSFTYERSHIRTSTFLDVEEYLDKNYNLAELCTYFLVAVCGLLIVIKNKYWAYLFALILLLASIHVLQVFLYTYSIGFLALKIELISAALLFLHVKFNQNLIKRIVNISGFNHSSTDQIHSDLVHSYQQKFESKSDDEIEVIIQSDSYTMEAKIAAKSIKEKRADSTEH